MKKKKTSRHLIEKSSLYNIQRRKDLARILGTSERELSLVSKAAPYSVKDVETSKGKIRHTETPTKQLRKFHERLTRLLMQIEPPNYLYCPVKGRSQVDNAARHRGSRIVHTLDIKEYFPSTPRRRVYWFFNKIMKCTTDVSAMLATLITKDDHLPTGSPLSPIMAFYAFFDIWNEVAAVAKSNGHVLTLYMDDVTLSGGDVSGDVVWLIKQIIYRSGLRYHKEKSYRDAPAIATGVVIDGCTLLLPHRQHEKSHLAREELARAKDPEDIQRLERRLRGLAGHRKQVLRIARSQTAEI